jgi:hypothetical protein
MKSIVKLVRKHGLDCYIAIVATDKNTVIAQTVFMSEQAARNWAEKKIKSI